MADIQNLLKTNVSTYKEPPKWPEGNYRMMITGYVTGTHAKSGAVGIAFTARALSCLEAEDDSNPELQDETIRKLEGFGDWTAKEHQWTYTDKETQEVHLMAFCPLNFLLQNEDGTQHNAASYFYFRDPQTQEESGFIHNVLGLTFPEGAELGEVLEQAQGREFYGMFEYVVNPKKPDQRPNLQLSEVTQV